MLLADRNGFAVRGAPTPPPGEYWGLCFTAEAANSTIAMSKNGAPPEVSLVTSPDGKTWTPFIVGETTITLPAVGDKVYFAAGQSGNTAFASSNRNYTSFTLNGSLAASGSIMSLLNATTPIYELTADFAFAYLFLSCSALVSAPELSASTLTTSCYQQMFRRCSSLSVGPKIFAESLEPNCFSSTFDGDSSLSWIEVAFTDWYYNGNLCTVRWLNGVSATGVFRCPTALGTDATITRSGNLCPTGWTVINTD